MRVHIEKIEERSDAVHPNNMYVGFTLSGKFVDPPTIGKRFYVGSFSTSIVRELVDSTTFKTLNSIYKWKMVEL
jgi:hypothetical protein